MKIGVMGGTFDPVHLGHLAVAGAAREALGLEQVVLVPAGRPLLKPERDITPSEHRLEMLRRAAAEVPFLEVSTLEIERPGPSYTADTVAAMRRRFPQDDLYFILGWGSLAQLPQWRDPARIIAGCRLAAAPRPGVARPDIRALEEKIPGITGRVVWLAGPEVDISATGVRELAARGRSLQGLVPDAVADYIKEKKLYR